MLPLGMNFFRLVLFLAISPHPAQSHPELGQMRSVARPITDSIPPLDSTLNWNSRQNETNRLWMNDFSLTKDQQHFPRSVPFDSRSSMPPDTRASAHQNELEPNAPIGEPTTSRTSWHSASRPFPRRMNSDRVNSPITYRYYGREQARKQGSIPFLFLGSNLDHWKEVAQRLAKQGFNSIVVVVNTTSSEGVGLVWRVMDALSWKRVIVVASDTVSATLSIRAASQFSDAVLGLVLCGELQERQIVLGLHEQNRPPSALYALDQFLGERLMCPFTIVWDGGGKASYSSPAAVNEDEEDLLPESLRPKRTVLIGGGSAPHRRCPDIFAWILTRFVEEKVEDHPRSTELNQQNVASVQQHVPSGVTSSSLDAVWTEESMVVFGRIVATALFYGIGLRILFFQYDNLQDVLRWILTTKQNVISTFQRLILGLLTALVPWSKSTAHTMEEGDQDVSALGQGGLIAGFSETVPLTDEEEVSVPDLTRRELDSQESLEAESESDDSNGGGSEPPSEASSGIDDLERDSLASHESVEEVGDEQSGSESEEVAGVPFENEKEKKYEHPSTGQRRDGEDNASNSPRSTTPIFLLDHIVT